MSELEEFVGNIIFGWKANEIYRLMHGEELEDYGDDDTDVAISKATHVTCLLGTDAIQKEERGYLSEN